jgi:hypothetical protein
LLLALALLLFENLTHTRDMRRAHDERDTEGILKKCFLSRPTSDSELRFATVTYHNREQDPYRACGTQVSISE